MMVRLIGSWKALIGEETRRAANRGLQDWKVGAYLKKMENIEGKLIIVNLSGRGDKDMIQAKQILNFD